MTHVFKCYQIRYVLNATTPSLPSNNNFSNSKTIVFNKIYVSNWKSVNKVRQVSDVTPQLFLTMKFHDVGMRMAFHDLSYMITIFWHHFFKDDLKEDLNELFNPYTWF